MSEISICRQKNKTFFKNRYWDLPRFARRNAIDFVILFVTANCNYNCKFCLYHNKRKANKGDLNLDEWIKIAQKFRPFHNLVISGGEPFLRKDLTNIIKAFSQYCDVRVVDFPTNGFNPELIFSQTHEICQNITGTDLSVSVSIDGLEATHDYLRGKQGSFNNAIETLHRLKELKKEYPALTITAQSTICSENLKELPQLALWIFEQRIADFHVFELVRGDIPSPDLNNINADELVILYKKLLDIQCEYLFCESDQLSSRDWYANATDLGEIFDLYSIQYCNRIFGDKWPFDCLAGQVSIVIDSDGDVRPCELRSSMGNLRDYDYNIHNILGTKKVKYEIKNIADAECDCTHVCSLLNSMERNIMRRLDAHPSTGMRLWAQWKKGDNKIVFLGND